MNGGKVTTRPLLSVIVPIYNGEHTVEKCLNSILAVDGNYEIIIINDGSIDNTAELLKHYRKNSKVRIYNKKNQGVSAARNDGLSFAKGEYVTFVDCDDYVNDTFITTIFRNINLEKSDLYIYKYKSADGASISANVDVNLSSSKERIISNTFFLTNSQFMEFSLRTVWGKVIKKQIISSYNIQFPVNISFGEDMLFMLYVYAHANSIRFINQYIYNYYFLNELSATNKYKPNIGEITLMQKRNIDTWLKKCNQSYSFYQKYILCYSLNDLILFLKFNLFHHDNQTDNVEKKEQFLLYLKKTNYDYNYEYCRATQILRRCKIQQRIIYWLAYRRFFYILFFIFKLRY